MNSAPVIYIQDDAGYIATNLIEHQSKSLCEYRRIKQDEMVEACINAEALGVVAVCSHPQLPQARSLQQLAESEWGGVIWLIGEGATISGAITISLPVHLPSFLRHIEHAIKLFRAEKYGFSLGEWHIEPARMLAMGANSNQRLTQLEVSLLHYLYQAKGKEISRIQLLKNVWGYVEDAQTATVENCIYRLRQKLEADYTNPILIKTGSLGYYIAAAL